MKTQVNVRRKSLSFSILPSQDVVPPFSRKHEETMWMEALEIPHQIQKTFSASWWNPISFYQSHEKESASYDCTQCSRSTDWSDRELPGMNKLDAGLHGWLRPIVSDWTSNTAKPHTSFASNRNPQREKKWRCQIRNNHKDVLSEREEARNGVARRGENIYQRFSACARRPTSEQIPWWF